MHWYVNVAGQAYGPYTDVQMQGFVREGRVNARSLISSAPQQGYFTADKYREFSLWQNQAQGAQAQAGQIQAGQAQAGQAQAGQMQAQLANVAGVGRTASYAQQPAHSHTGSPFSQNQGGLEAQAASRVFMVVAEIRSGGDMAFLGALQAFGKAQRIGDTNWLIRTSATVEHLRNRLSQCLDRQDRLFILDTQSGKRAWFNIGADLDHRIRELWDEDNS